ncbi:hypothetical protein BDZ97DRAFT_1667184, partial [Flammula alnicola]
QIYEQANCSIGLVFKVFHNFRAHGQVNNPFTKCTGRPRLLTSHHRDIEYISALLDANPVLYLDEIQRRMEATRNKNLSIASLARLLF